ncbi:uncharacterized protein BCR38DRAFT_450273 [Pseudomassariella vexata]|uniref:Uncharacterized protein n=1 Tax=Pseudomassariella vexata TaxID=1141098 RepID=A0A1Y2DCN9_9PEZI|nr:uncharacterized protein BCR38DRAFT_450273 [Pseudomassariella vexata]ORY56876.1 hypothetical protein BCR38DRAFT_450273 [Pseudomassariella vexata]
MWYPLKPPSSYTNFGAVPPRISVADCSLPRRLLVVLCFKTAMTLPAIAFSYASKMRATGAREVTARKAV